MPVLTITANSDTSYTVKLERGQRLVKYYNFDTLPEAEAFARGQLGPRGWISMPGDTVPHQENASDEVE